MNVIAISSCTYMSFSSRIANVAPNRQKMTQVSIKLIRSLRYGLVIQCTDITNRTRRTCSNCNGNRIIFIKLIYLNQGDHVNRDDTH